MFSKFIYVVTCITHFYCQIYSIVGICHTFFLSIHYSMDIWMFPHFGCNEPCSYEDLCGTLCSLSFNISNTMRKSTNLATTQLSTQAPTSPDLLCDFVHVFWLLWTSVSSASCLGRKPMLKSDPYPRNSKKLPNFMSSPLSYTMAGWQMLSFWVSLNHLNFAGQIWGIRNNKL